jgi:phosphopantetheinyl transferase (holo-ACP synthase)
MVRQRCVVVAFPSAGSVADLLCGGSAGRVFTARERRHALRHGSLATWAGRLAAKAAVLDLLGIPMPGDLVPPPDGLPWTAVEILPDRYGLCAAPEACLRSHRPAVTLHEPVAALLGAHGCLVVSISHSEGTAVALAVRTVWPSQAGGAEEAVGCAR